MLRMLDSSRYYQLLTRSVVIGGQKPYLLDWNMNTWPFSLSLVVSLIILIKYLNYALK